MIDLCVMQCRTMGRLRSVKYTVDARDDLVCVIWSDSLQMLQTRNSAAICQCLCIYSAFVQRLRRTVLATNLVFLPFLGASLNVECTQSVALVCIVVNSQNFGEQWITSFPRCIH